MADLTRYEVFFPAPGLDLAATLFCGQSFSWERCGDGSFLGVAAGRAARVLPAEGGFLLQSRKPLQEKDIAFWRHYFALDTDYAALHSRFARHKKLWTCVEAAPGVRVLRQPFFETLLCFIISQNNHIPRITGIVQRLREGFGSELAGGLYSFPSPGDLAALTPEDLAPIRAGFRAKYLIDAAQKVAEGLVSETALRGMPTEDARQSLLQIKGVGVKVADCVLLYALERDEVVPMDVWMKRAMEQVFPGGMPACTRGAEGIAQQYIFCWARDNLH